MLKAVDAEKTADEALRDLAQAEEEIGALQDLLRAHEGNQEVRDPQEAKFRKNSKIRKIKLLDIFLNLIYLSQF